MMSHNGWLRSLRRWRILQASVAAIALTFAAMGGTAHASTQTIYGSVRSDGTGLANYHVAMYAAWVDQSQVSHWVRIGSTVTDAAGNFTLGYSPPGGLPSDEPQLFVIAKHGPAMLASAIGEGDDIPGFVVVNDLTTVAVGNAFAQFIQSNSIKGNRYGMANAVYMAANFADPTTGALGNTIVLSPNGTETSTLATFNSLANVVAACVADASNCAALGNVTTPPGGSAPANVLQALSNLVKYPAYRGYPIDRLDPIFQLSQVDPAYQPALTRRPTNWLLFLKFTGGYYSQQNASNLMDGPGNIAIDKKGYVWINENYIPREPGKFTCAGRRLIKLYPWGENYPGSPYFGGGLSGAGYGITLDPHGLVWVGDFGFQDIPCSYIPPLAAANNSVSVFLPNGTPISPKHGFTQGGISWPQGTVSDRSGNIWVANCGNASVTRIPQGNVFKAKNIPLAAPPNGKQLRPFSVAIDLQGNAWITGNLGETVSIVSPSGDRVLTRYSWYQGRRVLRRPMGDASDIEGNVWVSNSDFVDSPCPPENDLGSAKHPSITMYEESTKEPSPGSPYTGGGLTLPWGIAVDGDDTVWVFNFGAEPFGAGGGSSRIPTGISRFCGVQTDKCPTGFQVGQPISPRTGYRSNALARITGGQIDTSGNVWMTSNWKIDVHPLVNPGGNSVVVAVGAAGPIRTPLLGPPVPFD